MQQIENWNHGRSDFGMRWNCSSCQTSSGEETLEQAVQHLYPMELSCDRESVQAPLQLNPKALTFKPRRDAVVALTMAYLMQKLMLIRDIWAH